MGLEDFDVLQSLGAGHFARVDKVKRKLDDKIYALKRLNVQDIPPKDLEDSLNEIRILVSFKHPRIIRCYETFFTDDSSELCIVMEYCPFGDLDQKIRRFYQRRKLIDEREIWVYAINILEGLVALHQKGVVHRDLKPANCLIDAVGCVKIADMNISKVSKGVDMKSQVGTPYFMSPEIYLKQPYSTTSDIWSLGCVLYDLAAQRPPFHADSIHNLKKAVIKGTYEPIPSVYSGDLTAIITKFMALNPTDRPEAKDALQDPILVSHKYLLRYPLRPEDEMSEGELFPTIRVAPDPVNENAKLITLPAPAYDDSSDLAGSMSSGASGPVPSVSGAAPPSPMSRLGQRSSSYSIILSPRRNTTSTKGGAPASPGPSKAQDNPSEAQAQAQAQAQGQAQAGGGGAPLPSVSEAVDAPPTSPTSLPAVAAPQARTSASNKTNVPKLEGIMQTASSLADNDAARKAGGGGALQPSDGGNSTPTQPKSGGRSSEEESTARAQSQQLTFRRESSLPSTARGSGPATARQDSQMTGGQQTSRRDSHMTQQGTGTVRRESGMGTARAGDGQQGTLRGEMKTTAGLQPPTTARPDARPSYLPTINDAPEGDKAGRASGLAQGTADDGNGETFSTLAEMRKMFNRNVTARLTRGPSEKDTLQATAAVATGRDGSLPPQQQQQTGSSSSSRDLLGRARGLWPGGNGGGSSHSLLNRGSSLRSIQPQPDGQQNGGTLGS